LRILHFYGLSEFTQSPVFLIVFGLSAFVLAAVCFGILCCVFCISAPDVFACHSLRVRNVDENFMRKICVQALCKTPNQIQDEAEVFASHVMFDEKSA
jgi:hypothetical protein